MTLVKCSNQWYDVNNTTLPVWWLQKPKEYSVHCMECWLMGWVAPALNWYIIECNVYNIGWLSSLLVIGCSIFVSSMSTHSFYAPLMSVQNSHISDISLLLLAEKKLEHYFLVLAIIPQSNSFKSCLHLMATTVILLLLLLYLLHHTCHSFEFISSSGREQNYLVLLSSFFVTCL